MTKNGKHRQSRRCSHIYIVLWNCSAVEQTRLLHPLHTHSRMSMCMILTKSGLLFGECRLFLLAMVVHDSQGHVTISMFHPRKVFLNLAVVWMGLSYPQHTPYPRDMALIRAQYSWRFLGGSRLCWPTMVGLDRPGHAHISKLHCKSVVLWIRLDYYILFPPILAPTVCMILAKFGLLSGESRLCWLAMVVHDGQGHVDIFMLHPCQGFARLMVICMGFQYPWHTHSIPECHQPN